MGYIGMCGSKGYIFSAILVINRVPILAILVINRVWFLHSSLIVSIRPSTKALHKIILGSENYTFWSLIGQGFWEVERTPPPNLFGSTAMLVLYAASEKPAACRIAYCRPSKMPSWKFFLFALL